MFGGNSWILEAPSWTNDTRRQHESACNWGRTQKELSFSTWTRKFQTQNLRKSICVKIRGSTIRILRGTRSTAPGNWKRNLSDSTLIRRNLDTDQLIRTSRLRRSSGALWVCFQLAGPRTSASRLYNGENTIGFTSKQKSEIARAYFFNMSGAAVSGSEILLYVLVSRRELAELDALAG